MFFINRPILMNVKTTRALTVVSALMESTASLAAATQAGQASSVKMTFLIVSRHHVRTMPSVLTSSKTTSACVPLERTANNVKLLQTVVLAILA